MGDQDLFGMNAASFLGSDVPCIVVGDGPGCRVLFEYCLSLFGLGLGTSQVGLMAKIVHELRRLLRDTYE